jgi:outer membrane immunogenic protein
MMKRSFLLSVVLCLVTGSAVAADMPLKAPPAYKPEAPFSWSGLYIGAHGGWLRSSNHVTDIDGRQDDEGTRFGYSGDSWLLGGHIGYNWQNGMMVLGVEADISGTGAKSNVIQDNTPGSGFDRDGLGQTKLSWLASVRGRVGFTPASQWLLYGTGGVAFGRVKNENIDFDDGDFDPDDSSSRSRVRTGWVAGGGVEVALWAKWIGRLEYLHYDLGHTNTETPSEFRFRFDNRIDVVRAGLSYKF